MAEPAAVLDAGGLVPAGTPVAADLPIDTVDARGYRHPGIPDRVVVRLVPDAVAAGVDTEMGLLGFALRDHADDVALQRRRTLGFPGHALVIDPEHARYALEVMREFKAHAKRIGSKPGHAKDGFDEIAGRLARQVPHFLPSYWEEVGRAFADAGNLSYAAQAFDKARAAELQFGLEVDEERRGEAFLEFALLGALSVKSLQAYGKELQRTVGPAKAYERLLALAVRRTLGGLPPWASLPKDLRGLAKAAKLDPAREDARFLREVLPASAIGRAPASFWAEYRDAVVHLAKADPAVRARLLDLFPTPGGARALWRGDDDGFADTWVELLREAGALDALWDPAAPAAALPQGGRAAWFGRLQEWARPGDGWRLQLLRRAAPVLAADGAPLPIHPGDWRKPLDLDLLDLALELGLRWVRHGPGAHFRVELATWAAQKPIPARAGFPAEPRPRDPVLAAADPAVRELLGPAIDQAFGNPTFEQVAAGLRGLAELRRRWLDQQVADLDRTGLAATALALGRLEAATSAATFAEFPEAYAALQRADVGRALHHTLATGIFDELGWPAFDRAVAELRPQVDVELHATRQWPHLLLASSRKLIVLGPKGVELEQDLKLGKDQLPDGTAFVGGQAWVAWSTWTSTGYQRRALWTGDPQDDFDVASTPTSRLGFPVEHPDALVYGGARFSVGDRVAAPGVPLQWHDATGAWFAVDGRIRRFDPVSGALGAEGAPGFLGDPGSATDASYYPLPPEVAATTPVAGALDGQYGAKGVTDPETGEVALVTLAGDRAPAVLRHGTQRWRATALVRWPGADRPRPVVEEVRWWRAAHAPSFYVGDPDQPVVALAHDAATRMGHAWLPPLLFWHFLAPRDPAGSRALRALARAPCDRILAAAAVEEDGSTGATEAAIGEALPAVTDPQVRAGIAHVARLAARLKARLAQLVALRAGGTVAPVAQPAEQVSDEAAADALGNLRRYWSWGGASVTAAIRSLGRFLREGETGESVSFSRMEPHEWIGRIRGVAWAAARPGTTAAQRETLAKVLTTWATSGLAADGDLRVGTLRFSAVDPSWMPVREVNGKRLPHAGWRNDDGGWRLFAWGVAEHDEDGPWTATFVDTAVDGVFRDPPGAEILQERRARIAGDRAWLEAFVAALLANGPRPASAEEAAALAAAIGVSPPEAAVLLAGFPAEWDKEVREGFGLKLVEAKAASQQFARWSIDRKLELLQAAAPDDPRALWTDPVGPLAAAYVAAYGLAVAVPADLLAAADKELPRGGGANLKWLANHADAHDLRTDARWEVDPTGKLAPSVPGAFSAGTALVLAHLLPWLSAKLPVGDPLRAAIPAVYARARERLANRSLAIATGPWHLYDPKARKAAEAFLDALGGEVATTPGDGGEPITWQRRAGPLVATKLQWAIHLAFRPAELDPGARALVERFVEAAGTDLAQLHAVELLASDDFAALVARVTDTPLGPGEWEQDPARSAPEVLAAVASAHGLSSEAAALYLQTLALLDPTKKNVITWNGWSPKTYAAAAAELAAKGLAIEGKRPRAGREHFLPGGWSEKGDPLPYEDWKRPLYGWDAATGRFRLGRPCLAAPLHQLYARAWERCRRGDAPAFEEVRR